MDVWAVWVMGTGMAFENVSFSGSIESMLCGKLMMLFTQGLISSKFFGIFISCSIYISILFVCVYHIFHRWNSFVCNRIESRLLFCCYILLVIGVIGAAILFRIK